MTPSLDPYIVQHANCRASLLVSTAHFATDDWEDLRQEILLDYIHRAPKFDPTRGDLTAFVRGVMRNHATVLFTRRSRRVQQEILAEDLADSGSEAIDTNDNILETLHPYDNVNSVWLSIDVRRVLDQLPVQLQVLAGLLIDLPAGEIPVRIGKSRSRVYQMTGQLRDAFVRAGLGPRASDK